MKDAIGREIQVGDTVVYPTMSGRSITMRGGEVLEVGEKSIRVRPRKGLLRDGSWRDRYSTPAKDVTIHRVENVVRV